MTMSAFVEPVLSFVCVCVCVCTLSNRACNAPALYYILSFVASATLPYFSISHKRHDFRRDVIDLNCVL